jgi:hypothetical protein
MTLVHRWGATSVGVCVLAMAIGAAAAGTAEAAETSIRLETHSRDYVNADRSFLLTPTEGRFTGGGGSGGVIITFRPNDLLQPSWWLEFRPPDGQSLAPGVYYEAARAGYRWPGQPGLWISGGSLDCDRLTGAFEIRQMTVSGGALTSFWATFEQSCELFSGEKRGEVRFNVETVPAVSVPITADVERTRPLTVSVGTDGFSSAPPNLTATGLPVGAEFTDMRDGSANLSWTPTYLQAGQYDVPFRADGIQAAAATTRIRVGGVTSLVIESTPGDPVTGGSRFVYTTADAEMIGRTLVFSNTPLSIAVLSFRSSRINWQLQFAGPDGRLPDPGVYENVAGVYFQGPGQAGMSISGSGHGCSAGTGRFEVHQADYGPFGYIRSFWASFEQYCGGQAFLRGEVRFNADPLVWMRAPGRIETRSGERLMVPVAGFTAEGLPPILRATGLQDGAVFTEEGEGTGRLEWTPGPGQLGPSRVTFEAEDSLGALDAMATDFTVYAANDDLDHAAPLGDLPSTATLDRFWATRAPDDPDCGYSGAATVWYSFTPSEDVTVNVDSAGSGTPYVTLGAFTGPRGALTRLACLSQGMITFPASAGVTYYLMAGISQPGVPLTISAWVAPPVPQNDDFDAATAIGALPFGDSVNTLRATTAPDDPSFPYLPCTYAAYTVWYAFTPSTDVRIVADTIGSDFRPTLAALTGARGSLRPIACDNSLDGEQPRISFTAFAGTTYYFMIGSLNAYFPGGNLVFSVRGLVPLQVQVTLDPRGTVDVRRGTATVSGRAICSRPITFDLFVAAFQDLAGDTQGTSTIPVACSGDTPWSATLIPSSGLFRPGPSYSFVATTAYDPETQEVSQPYAETTLVLIGRRPGPVQSTGRARASSPIPSAKRIRGETRIVKPARPLPP